MHCLVASKCFGRIHLKSSYTPCDRPCSVYYYVKAYPSRILEVSRLSDFLGSLNDLKPVVPTLMSIDSPECQTVCTVACSTLVILILYAIQEICERDIYRRFVIHTSPESLKFFIDGLKRHLSMQKFMLNVYDFERLETVLEDLSNKGMLRKIPLTDPPQYTLKDEIKKVLDCFPNNVKIIDEILLPCMVNLLEKYTSKRGKK